MSDVQVVLIIAIAGAGIWFVLMYASSVLGGWSTLAHAYRATQPFKGRLWHGQFVAMRHYWGYGLITVGASSEGLHMSLYVLGPLQYHPALFIPWRDVTVGKRARFKGILRGRAEVPSSAGGAREDQRVVLDQALLYQPETAPVGTGT